MIKRIILGTSVSTLVLMSGTALAAEQMSMEQIQAQLAQLAAQVENLSKVVEQQNETIKQQETALQEQKQASTEALTLISSPPAHIGVVPERQESTQALATLSPASGKDEKPSNIGDLREFRKGDFTLKPFGRINIDAASFNDDEIDHPNGAEFRRIRLGVKGDLPGDFGYKLQIGFADEQTDIEDAFITYNGIQNTQFILGNHKPFFGLEELNSSKDAPFIERAASNDAFAPGRAIGLSASTYGERWTASAGIFNEDPGVSSDDDEGFSLSARLTGLPVKTDKALVHLGASVDFRNPGQEDETFEFEADADNSIQAVESVSVSVPDSDNAVFYGLEAAAIYGPFSAQAEYFIADVNTNSGPSPQFDGGYGQVAWVVTGESRKYKTASGLIGRPKPDKPFDPSKGDWGALELAARYSTLDLSDETFIGGELDTIALGANWYPNKYLRFSGNYIIADTDENAPVPNDDPELLLFRAQVAF